MQLHDNQVSTLEEVNTKLLSEVEEARTGMIQLQREYRVISLKR